MVILSNCILTLHVDRNCVRIDLKKQLQLQLICNGKYYHKFTFVDESELSVFGTMYHSMDVALCYRDTVIICYLHYNPKTNSKVSICSQELLVVNIVQ